MQVLSKMKAKWHSSHLQRWAMAAGFSILAACAPEGYEDDPLFSSTDDLAPLPIEPSGDILDAAAARDAAANPTDGLAERGAQLRNRAEALRLSNAN